MFLSLEDFRCTNRSGLKIFEDSTHHTEKNIDTWLTGIQSAKSGDALGVLWALEHAQGEARLINNKGKPARNRIATQARKLNKDGYAMRRLNESQPHWRPSMNADPDAPRASTDISSLLWAINPNVVAQAVRLWRQKSSRTLKWYHSRGIFFSRCDNKIKLRSWLSLPMARHFNPSPEGQEAPIISGALNASPPPKNSAFNDSQERKALRVILTELSMACIEERWKDYEKEAQARQDGFVFELDVWNTSSIGLNWEESSWNVSESDAPCKPAWAQGVDHLLHEAFLESKEHASEVTRRVVIVCTREHKRSAAAAALNKWAGAFPEAPEGLPLDAYDKISHDVFKKLISESRVSNDSLARWLSGAGMLWRAPASLNYDSKLVEISPNQSRLYSTPYLSKGEDVDPKSLTQWRIGDWLLESHPQAVMAACSSGFVLAQDLEVFVKLDQGGYSEPSKKELIFSGIEACRIRESLSEKNVVMDVEPKRKRSL